MDYTCDMIATLSLLLDDGGAHILTSAVPADDLLALFSANGVACLRSAADDGAKLQLVKAEQILQAHALLQEWLKRKGLHDTLHDQSPHTDTRHS